MALTRSPLQGITNVLSFNWHFYAFAIIVLLTMVLSSHIIGNEWEWLFLCASILVVVTTVISLLVTYYVYDYSDLYDFKWLDDFPAGSARKILNINAGFDETSSILAEKFKGSELHVCDFYDPHNHTEISIKRARKAYPPHPSTVKVRTNSLPYSDQEFDVVCIAFAAHEIRNTDERQQFFEEIKRVTNVDGRIFVTEHLRDIHNFLAYTIGCFHFYSRADWIGIFLFSQLNLLEERKTTAFVRTFTLTTNGATS